MKQKNHTLRYIFLALVFAFCYAPIASLILFSFNDGTSLTRWSGFSFRWYVALFESQQIMGAVFTTIMIAIFATVISTIIGTLAAIALSRSKRLFRDMVLNVNNLPIVNPEIVTAVGLLLLFVSLGVNLGLTTMLLAHIAFCVPYVIITVYPKVRSLDPSLADAAMDLGATPMQALIKVILPQIKVSVIAAASIAFTMSFDDFVISYFTAGTATNISIYLYTMRRAFEPTINALSTIIITIIAFNVIYSALKHKRKQKTLFEED